MRSEDKARYLEDYEAQRSRGDMYFPRYALRDMSAGLALLLILIGLSAWLGAPLDARADPASTDYVPRPEWYFFFIFQMLKYFSGDTEVYGVVVIPMAAVFFLTMLPFLDRSRFRHFRRRPVVTGITVLLSVSAFTLTALAVVEAPPPADASNLVFAAEGIDGEAQYATNCSSCHGDLGEGGPNPAQAGDVIPPISTAEYLASRTDDSLRTVIAEGLPELGMAPFAIEQGGPLQPEAIDAIVAYVRSWEDDPPVQLDTSVSAAGLSNSSEFLFSELCARCHGEAGTGDIGPSFADPEFQQTRTDDEIFSSINLGHPATRMQAWGEVLTKTQIAGLVDLIRTFGTPVDPGVPRYSVDVFPIFEVRCLACHGSSGGWDASTRQTAVESGDHAPVVIPGDAANSILAQMMQGTHPDGILMPPDGKLPDALVQLVIDWIEGGAPE